MQHHKYASKSNVWNFQSNSLILVEALSYGRKHQFFLTHCVLAYNIPVLLGGITLVRGITGYSHQTFRRMICRSVCACVRPSVGLSSALWRNSRSDPDAVWQHRSDGSRDEADSGVWNRSTGRGTFGGEFGATIVTNGDFTVYVCDSASTIGAAVWGGACSEPATHIGHSLPQRGPVPKLLLADLFSNCRYHIYYINNVYTWHKH